MGSRGNSSKKNKGGSSKGNVSLNAGDVDHSLTEGLHDALKDPEINRFFCDMFGDRVAEEVKRATSHLTFKTDNLTT